MNDKTFMAVIGVIIVAVIGAFFIFGGEDSGNGGAFIGEPLEIATGVAEGDEAVQRADHVVGPVDAKVVLIEYADFECPACAGFWPQLKQIEAAFPDDLAVVYRHNPLSSLHPNAFAAHRAAVAAANQGMFWEMHDLLYQRQNEWAAATSGLTVSQAADRFEQYAQELSLNMEQFTADVESSETFDFIDSHLDSGNQLGVTGTPTLFLNGEEITERSAEELIGLIQDILDSQDGGDAGDSEEATSDTDSEPEAEN